MIKETNWCRKSFVEAGKPETLDWGWRWLVDDELDAYRIAYHIRNNPFGVKVEFCPNINQYSVTMFNEFSTTIGIDRS